MESLDHSAGEGFQSCLRKNPLVVWFQIQHDVLTGQELETVALNRRSIRELSKILLFCWSFLLRWVHNSASHLKKRKGRRSAENTCSSAIPNLMKSWNPSTTGFLQKLHSNAWGCSRGGADWGVLGGGRLTWWAWCGCKGWFDAELVKWLNQNLNSWDPWFAKMSVIVFCLGKVILPMCPGYLARYKTNCAIGMMNSFSIYIYT